MDKNFWDCHCLTDYVQVKTAAVCEKCQALKVNKEGYDTVEDYKFKHNRNLRDPYLKLKLLSYP